MLSRCAQAPLDLLKRRIVGYAHAGRVLRCVSSRNRKSKRPSRWLYGPHDVILGHRMHSYDQLLCLASISGHATCTYGSHEIRPVEAGIRLFRFDRFRPLEGRFSCGFLHSRMRMYHGYMMHANSGRSRLFHRCASTPTPGAIHMAHGTWGMHAHVTFMPRPNQ